MYTEKELVRVAKRENNNKRKYLVVNRYQGKHIPVVPSEALKMFGELASLIKKEYKEEQLLLIGFAETATAIGAACAAGLGCRYIQTTREAIENVNYLYFSEAHSHATEQKLVKEDIELALPYVDRVVFIEDEVTTGNTIMNIIQIMKKQYPEELRFSIASILNGMDGGHLALYEEQGIRVHYLVKTDHSGYEKEAGRYEADGTHHGLMETGTPTELHTYECTACLNARRLVNGYEMTDACEKLWNQIEGLYSWKQGEKILVLGTEEFMYPPLYTASKLEEAGCEVRYHATTRSPIAVSRDPGYPLHERYELRSFYEKDRVTYIYDLGRYDRVLVITDADGKEDGASLLAALKEAGNENVSVIRWCR